MWQPSPSPALQSGVQQGEQWWLDPAEGARQRKETEVLFVHDVDGRARFAALVERGDDEHVRDWRLSSWAMCEPSELTGDASDRLGYGVWIDADGDPVPTTEVMTFRGPEHCGGRTSPSSRWTAAPPACGSTCTTRRESSTRSCARRTPTGWAPADVATPAGGAAASPSGCNRRATRRTW